MIVAGVDIGSLSAKAVIMQDDGLLASAIILSGPDSAATAKSVIDQALEFIGLSLEKVDYLISTGYGRVNVPFSHGNVTEISCHAKGTSWLFPRVRTILDMGGQDCKAIRCNEKGKVTNFIMNDKCAAGTGRYLERIARLVQLPLEEIGPRSLEPLNGALNVDSYCVMFAENDILQLLREGRQINDILAGATEALIKRILSLLERVGIEKDFSISGGVAKNIGVVKRLEERLGLKACLAFDPQLVGAIGAALFAREKLTKKMETS